MKITALKKKMQPPPVLGVEKTAQAVRTDGAYVRETDFLPEEVFQEILSLERKRSERSRKEVVLMLLDLTALGDGAARCGAARGIAQSLNASMQNSHHIRGWYRHRTILGVLFTNPGGAGPEATKERIQAALPAALLQQVAALNPLFLSFPLLQNAAAGNGDGAALFYPDSDKSKTRSVSLFFKRAMDIAGALAGLLLFSPLFIMFPLLIRLSSPGPVLFRQERIGKHGRKFVFLKFRTMVVNNDPGIHQEYIKKLIRQQQSYEHDPDGQTGIYKIKDDPRVTRIGRFLRKSSLDELPQFINVLKGEMSLVGPRPPIPYELAEYEPWHFRRVMEIKPGITGLWQVGGRSSTTFDEMVRLDLKYAREWSLWLDIKILLKTPGAVIAGKGAY